MKQVCIFQCNLRHTPNEARKHTHGTKAQKAKDRATITTCTNAIGTLAMIGKAKEF